MELKDLTEQFYGRRLKVVGKHPHSGSHGKIVEVQNTISGVGFVVKLEDGSSCFVFKQENIEWED